MGEYDARAQTAFLRGRKSPANFGFFDDSTLKTESTTGKYRSAHDKGGNDCVMRKAVANVKTPQYCLLGKAGPVEKYNCQDWADAVRAEYRRLIKDPSVVSACCPTDAEKKK